MSEFARTLVSSEADAQLHYIFRSSKEGGPLLRGYTISPGHLAYFSESAIQSTRVKRPGKC